MDEDVRREHGWLGVCRTHPGSTETALAVVLMFLVVEIAFRMPFCILEACRRIDMALFEGRLRRAQARQQEVDGEEGVQATGFRWTQPNEEQN